MITRQQKFRAIFNKQKEFLKVRYGTGLCSWTENMTRKAARKIAIRLTRKEIKDAKETGRLCEESTSERT